MVSDNDGSSTSESIEYKNKKRKRLLMKQQIQQQQIILSGFRSDINNNNKPPKFAQMETFSFRATGRGAKKNQNIKLLDNVKVHNYWSNIFRRKSDMHKYFSEAAFGSQSDTKMEFRNLWEITEYRKKYLPQNYLDSNIENELK